MQCSSQAPNPPICNKKEQASLTQRATGSKAVKGSFKRLKGCLVCNSPFFLSFYFMSSSPHPWRPMFSTVLHPKPPPKLFHHLPLHSAIETSTLPNLALSTTTLSTLLSPLVSARLERSSPSEMLLRAMSSWTLKSLLRGDKSLGTSVLNQTDISLESLRISAIPRACTGNVRSHKQAKGSREGKRGLLGAALELLLPGNFTGQKWGEAPVPAGQVHGPRVDGCRCNNSIFISGVMPPISYRNYRSTHRDDSTHQLVLDRCHLGTSWIFCPWKWSPVLIHFEFIFILNVNLGTGFFYCLDIQLMREEKPLKIAGKGRWFRIQSVEHFSKPTAN